jgi:hypothetical protein
MYKRSPLSADVLAEIDVLLNGLEETIRERHSGADRALFFRGIADAAKTRSDRWLIKASRHMSAVTLADHFGISRSAMRDRLASARAGSLERSGA